MVTKKNLHFKMTSYGAYNLVNIHLLLLTLLIVHLDETCLESTNLGCNEAGKIKKATEMKSNNRNKIMTTGCISIY